MMTSHCLLVGNDTTSCLLIGIASFASALIEYKYSRSRRLIDHQAITKPLARKSGPQVIIRLVLESVKVSTNASQHIKQLNLQLNRQTNRRKNK